MNDSYDDLLEKGLDETVETNQGDRFQMPEADTRKDGSKTIITNFKQIAETFGRDKKEFSNFIQDELGTSGHLERGELVLNGEFRRGNVQGRIENYADEWVFCKECESPDTKIVKEKGVEMMKCQECGARTTV